MTDNASPRTKGYRIAGELVTDAVGAEFGRLIAERDRLDMAARAAALRSPVAGTPREETRDFGAELDRFLTEAGEAVRNNSDTLTLRERELAAFVLRLVRKAAAREWAALRAAAPAPEGTP